MGKGALLPSVANAGALQPCVGGLQQSIIIVGNKRQLPAKSWSALLFAESANHFCSRNVEMFLRSQHRDSKPLLGDWGHFGAYKVLYLIKSYFIIILPSVVVIIGTDRQQILSSEFRASILI